MADDQLTIEALKRWSQILLWVSVILPVLGGIAAGARYYVERKEKQLSSAITGARIDAARTEASTARAELEDYRTKNAARRIGPNEVTAIAHAAAAIRSLPVKVACRMMDGESCDFGSDIADALRAGALSVPELVRTSLNDLPGVVAIHTPANATGQQTNELIAALAAGGVHAERHQIAPNSIGELHPGYFYIVVGRKGG
ncbi:hypothetical protein ACFOED_10155 [Vulcaniibacterium thermophilum]|uniref:Uncharacterized protein n=1 Tax=Vulcaniibacterium thermophilum TaxID=1169913 RepID=A0A918ZD09_9GAMM|nr:hypothetical protein [Vulcaniibacterium thermophilum]GHE44975.1 hypothetical protein GCM10007167_28210 [Vulcaniibacterium thermophilum]